MDGKKMDFELLLRAVDIQTQRDNAMAGGEVEAGPAMETAVDSVTMTEGEQVRSPQHLLSYSSDAAVV